MTLVTGTLLAEAHMTTDRGEAAMAAVSTELPDLDEHGRTGTWEIKDQGGEVTLISGVFLGMGTSWRPEHKGHRSDVSAPRGTHCSTCRWTEIRIFRGESGLYYVVNCGASDVPGERDLIKVTPVSTAFEVVENLTSADRQTRRATLTFPARRVLAQAASHDADLRDAYINSPVT